jgi:hypothetical protein
MHVSKIHLPIRGSASRFVLYSALAFALVLAFSVVASAQDTYRVTYFDNNGAAGAPDAFVHILDPGVATVGLCATIYVWRNDQELSECCSCPITHNGLLALRVSALTANPGDHAGSPTSGSIGIVSDSACDPTAPVPTPDLRAWATHVNIDTVSGFDVTETEALDTPLSSGEQSEASSRCSFIRVNGSGVGRCDAACSGTGPA